MKGKKVLIIIPAFNEEKNISALLDSLSSYRNQFNVIVIDDGSLDQTAQIVQQRKFPVIQLAANLGIGGAVQTGFKYAVNKKFDYAVQVDGDGQHDPAWIQALLEPLKRQEADCVIGSRYLKKNPDIAYQTPFFRRIGMWFSSMLLFIATGVFISDTTSGFRALNFEAFSFFAHEYPIDHPEAETLFLLLRAGFKIKEVPIKMKKRAEGKSLFSFSNSILYPIRVLIGFAGVVLQRKETRK